MTWYTYCLFFVILTPVVSLGYILSLWHLFSYMNTDEDPALKPEQAKIAWQAAFFLFSTLSFFTVRMLIITESITSLSDVILALQVSSLISDVAPITYVVYCHRRSFKRQQEFYQDY